MSVGSLCARKVVTVRRNDDLQFAGRLMREKHIGYLIVVDTLPREINAPVGVLTDRDIVVAVVAQDVNPRNLTVGEVMTAKPLVVEETLAINAALAKMRERGVRRAPVVGADGGLVGVISMDDVLEQLADQLANVAGVIRNEQSIERVQRT
jgi:CBS domain-containing protein